MILNCRKPKSVVLRMWFSFLRHPTLKKLCLFLNNKYHILQSTEESNKVIGCICCYLFTRRMETLGTGSLLPGTSWNPKSNPKEDLINKDGECREMSQCMNKSLHAKHKQSNVFLCSFVVMYDIFLNNGRCANRDTYFMFL